MADASAKARELELYNEPLHDIATSTLLVDANENDDNESDMAVDPQEDTATTTADAAVDADGRPKKRARVANAAERDAGLALMQDFLKRFAATTDQPVPDKAAALAELENIKHNAFVADVCQRIVK